MPWLDEPPPHSGSDATRRRRRVERRGNCWAKRRHRCSWPNRWPCWFPPISWKTVSSSRPTPSPWLSSSAAARWTLVFCGSAAATNRSRSGRKTDSGSGCLGGLQRWHTPHWQRPGSQFPGRCAIWTVNNYFLLGLGDWLRMLNHFWSWSPKELRIFGLSLQKQWEKERKNNRKQHMTWQLDLWRDFVFDGHG